MHLCVRLLDRKLGAALNERFGMRRIGEERKEAAWSPKGVFRGLQAGPAYICRSESGHCRLPHVKWLQPRVILLHLKESCRRRCGGGKRGLQLDLVKAERDGHGSGSTDSSASAGGVEPSPAMAWTQRKSTANCRLISGNRSSQKRIVGERLPSICRQQRGEHSSANMHSTATMPIIHLRRVRRHPIGKRRRKRGAASAHAKHHRTSSPRDFRKRLPSIAKQPRTSQSHAKIIKEAHPPHSEDGMRKRHVLQCPNPVRKGLGHPSPPMNLTTFAGTPTATA